jgi:hypothetical protein
MQLNGVAPATPVQRDSIQNMISPSQDIHEIDELISTLENEAQVLSSSTIASQTHAPSKHAEQSKIKALARHVYHLASPGPDGLLTGVQLRPLMLMSKLPMNVLADVWNAVDVNRTGKVFYPVYNGCYFR